MEGSIRSDPRAIDGSWLTEALEAAGVARGATVTDVRFDGFHRHRSDEPQRPAIAHVGRPGRPAADRRRQVPHG